MKTQTTKYCLRRSDSSLSVRSKSRPSSTCISRALNANPFYFAGQYLNKASSLYYLRARWYDPATAQFISVDPLVNVTHQPYQYVGDNPVSNTDPTGECQCISSSTALTDFEDGVLGGNESIFITPLLAYLGVFADELGVLGIFPAVVPMELSFVSMAVVGASAVALIYACQIYTNT